MDKTRPLAERLRPTGFDNYFGQEHLVGKDKLFRRSVEDGKLGSCIFWGPPGCGKTSLARVIANVSKKPFVSFSAVLQGVKEVRAIVEKAEAEIKAYGTNTILFIDEIHRFNKAQQDALLPHVEKGTVILIGATTENPSFEIIGALLSRAQVYVLQPLSDDDIKKIINRAIQDKEQGLGALNINIDSDAMELLVNIANGDVRTALNSLEQASIVSNNINVSVIKEAIVNRRIAYDKGGEEHYNLISALHKSLRGSDVNAGLYWLGRMIEGGADPLYIARRLIRFASEDIGLADPNALVQAVAVKDAVHFLGFPECNTALAQCVIYLATAPKSNSVYMAVKSVEKSIYNKRNEPVPLHIRNAPTKLMKELDYGKGYEYDHSSENHYSGQDFLPDSLIGSVFYKPGVFGFEKEIQKRLDYWKKIKTKLDQTVD